MAIDKFSGALGRILLPVFFSVVGSAALASPRLDCPCSINFQSQTSVALTAGFVNTSSTSSGDLRLSLQASQSINFASFFELTHLAVPSMLGGAKVDPLTMDAPIEYIGEQNRLYYRLAVQENLGGGWITTDSIRMSSPLSVGYKYGETYNVNGSSYDVFMPQNPTLSLAEDGRTFSLSIPAITSDSSTVDPGKLTIELYESTSPTLYGGSYYVQFSQDTAADLLAGESLADIAVNAQLSFQLEAGSYLNLAILDALGNLRAWQTVYSDSDVGIPHQSATLNSVDYLTDLDGDGVADYSEQLAGTDRLDAADLSPQSKVRILLLQSTNLPTYAGYDARVEHITSYANQVLSQSGVDIALEFVGPIDIAGTDSVESLNNGGLLDALTARQGPFVDVDALREQNTADLVIYLDRSKTQDTSCGVAWLSGLNTHGDIAPDLLASIYNVGVVDIDSEFCSTRTLVHEVGHLLGLGHSRRQGSEGSFAWALGHGEDDNFATVMAYESSFGTAVERDYFSSPVNLDCNELACGVSKDDLVAGADAALALNAIRVQAANIAEGFAPQVTLVGAPEIAVALGDVFNDPGAEAFDFEDGDLSAGVAVTDAPDTGAVGVYEVTYSATDFDGNTATVTRVVNVFDPSLVDTDADGVADLDDAFPNDAAVSVDTDNDGLPDDWNSACDVSCQAASALIIDTDDDNDLVPDLLDAFPLDANETLDTDRDRIGNNADLDDDNDSLLDTEEITLSSDPLVANYAVAVGVTYACAVVDEPAPSDGNTVNCWDISDSTSSVIDWLTTIQPLPALAEGEVWTAISGRYAFCGIVKDTQSQLNRMECFSPSPDDFIYGWNEFWSSIPDVIDPYMIDVSNDNSCVAHSQGLSCWGANAQAYNAPNLLDVQSLSVNHDLACAIASSELSCWGGVVGNVPAEAYQLADPQFVSLGQNNGCVANDNELLCWNISGGTSSAYFKSEGLVVNGLAVADYRVCVVSGSELLCGPEKLNFLDDAGAINQFFGAGNYVSEPAISDVSQLAAGYRFFCALANLSIECWGVNWVFDPIYPAPTSLLIDPDRDNVTSMYGLDLTPFTKDRDNDLVPDEADFYPDISLEGRADLDGDGIPDSCDDVCLEAGMMADQDRDGDGVLNSSDGFADDPTRFDRGILVPNQSWYIADEVGSNPTVTIDIARSRSTEGEARLSFTTRDTAVAAAGTDFVGQAGELVWLDGESGVKQIELELIPDQSGSGKLFYLDLATDTAGLQLVNTQIAVQFGRQTDSAAFGGLIDTTGYIPVSHESDGLARVRLKRYYGSKGQASVDYQLVNGVTRAVIAEGAVTWGDGDAQDKVLEIPIADSTLLDGPCCVLRPDAAWLYVTLSNYQGTAAGAIGRWPNANTDRSNPQGAYDPNRANLPTDAFSRPQSNGEIKNSVEIIRDSLNGVSLVQSLALTDVSEGAYELEFMRSDSLVNQATSFGFTLMNATSGVGASYSLEWLPGDRGIKKVTVENWPGLTSPSAADGYQVSQQYAVVWNSRIIGNIYVADFESQNTFLAARDTDGDGISDLDDLDNDNDGLVDALDQDLDNDGIENFTDLFPYDASEWLDSDGDGLGNNADLDDDNDGTLDSRDALPFDASEIRDTDGDGVGDNADTDDDNDGIPDDQDLFPTVAYEGALLAADLTEQTMPFGIVDYIRGAVDEPTISTGVAGRAYQLMLDGTYKASDDLSGIHRGSWSSLGQGYVLKQTAGGETYYPVSNGQELDNIDWQGLGQDPAVGLQTPSGQIGLIRRMTTRLAVIEQGPIVWRVARQVIFEEYAEDTSLVIDPSKPVRVFGLDSVADTVEILSPDINLVPFTNDEVVGSWSFNLANVDNFEVLPICDRYRCSDIVEFYADGSALTRNSARTATWSLTPSGGISLVYADTGAELLLDRIAQGNDVSTVLVRYEGTERYVAEMTMMVKEVPFNESDLSPFYGTPISSGFNITDVSGVFSTRSPFDGGLIANFGFILDSVGTGLRFSVSEFPPDLSADLVELYRQFFLTPNDITWSQTERRITSELCRSTFELNGETVCRNLQTRSWDILRVTSDRLYVLETLDYRFDGDGDGVREEIYALTSRMNFYEITSYYDLNDVDRDSYANDVDRFPTDPTEWRDSDDDGIGDNSDEDTGIDTDGDGVLDLDDAFDTDAAASVDTDGDGMPDDWNANATQAQIDASSLILDDDDDNDGFSDEQELNDGTDPTDPSDFLSPYDDLNGTVYHWKSHALLEGVTVSVVESALVDSASPITQVTDTSGAYVFADVPEGSYELSASKPTEAADLNRTVTSADALAALKIAVGLNPNSDPDGTGPLEALPVSPYQLIAADINGDGRVSSSDALAILKIAVGLTDAGSPYWAFVEDGLPIWESHATQGNVYDSSVTRSVNYPAQTQANFVAILVGDVNGSWGSDTASLQSPDYFTSQAINSGAPLSIWGISDRDGDGLSDEQEAQLGTNPDVLDSDSDGVNDALDAYPTDPNRTGDSGASGQTDWELGVFSSSSTFKNACESPRSGTDPFTGQSFVDTFGTAFDEKNWLRSWTNELYLWFDEVVDRDPSLIYASANSSRTEAESYFAFMKTEEQTPSGVPKDRYHFAIDSDEWYQLSQGGVSYGYGMEFVVLNASPPRDVRVAYVHAGSPAADAGIKRGDKILKVDGVSVLDGSPDALNAGLFPDAEASHDFVFADRDTNLERAVSLQAGTVSLEAVQNRTIIPTATGNVGYLAFHDHIATSESLLIDAISYFSEQGVSDLVVDFRYNGGGYLDIASQFAYMVAGQQTQGKTFERLQFNAKHSTVNPVTGQTLTPIPFHTQSLGFSALPGQALPTLNLDRVFAITSAGTCSASEAFINGLRGIGVEVIMIGGSTCGKPYGFYPTPNCGTTYFSVQFRGVNALGYGDYADGFFPVETPDPTRQDQVLGCSVADDFTRELGDPSESRLATALYFRDFGQCPGAPSGAAEMSRTFPNYSVEKGDARTVRVMDIR